MGDRQERSSPLDSSAGQLSRLSILTSALTWLLGKLGIVAFLAVIVWVALMVLPGGRTGLEAKLGRVAAAPWEIVFPPPTAMPSPTRAPRPTPSATPILVPGEFDARLEAARMEAALDFGYDVVYLGNREDASIGAEGSVLPPGAPAFIMVYLGGERFTDQHPSFGAFWKIAANALRQLTQPDDEYIYFFFAMIDQGIYFIYSGSRCPVTEDVFDVLPYMPCDELSDVAILLAPDFLTMVGLDARGAGGGLGPMEESFPK